MFIFLFIIFSGRISIRAAGLFMLVSGLSSMAIANTQDEYAVKSALTRNIAVFTQWPESAYHR